MKLLERTIKQNRPDIYKEVEKEVLYFQKEFIGSNELILQNDIFRVIEDIEGLDLLLFPAEDDEFCGFLFEYRDQTFIYVNSFLPYEKQIFTAAHELYHFLSNCQKEFLHSSEIEENQNLNTEENKANLFAALLLVPDESLTAQLNILKVKNSSDLDQLKIIKLMDIYAVPYKTIILRLFEIELLTAAETKKWLAISDRDPEKGILYQIKKHKIGERWQKRTGEIKFSNLQALILDNDELELLPEVKINKDLTFTAQVDNNG